MRKSGLHNMDSGMEGGFWEGLLWGMGFRRSVEEDKKKCRFCGRMIPADARFCPYCGRRLREDR